MSEVRKCVKPAFGTPEYCCHVMAGLYTNWIYCGLVENKDHTGYKKCQDLRYSGKCPRP